MAEYASLNAAMAAKDDLGEAELRYRLLSETFEAEPKLRGNLNSALERAKAEIVRLRAAKQTSGPSPVDGKVVAFDPERFRKSGS
ncbi:hypothetical protein [Mycolicibacterium chlorophenolicum]|uniref:Terminase small subunit n=1 Tax=Mycolicibacterium chlorophenolicum TaxID=37916 RepID=A0A0J6VKV7_9MYCO|nr:hypothetical protein [Mycolicibacterium chlorophenolicum]KMO70083.1 hypothetical protein MCHLDSM_04968 [Mycolicibacterium chlorophenolicum]